MGIRRPSEAIRRQSGGNQNASEAAIRGNQEASQEDARLSSRDDELDGAPRRRRVTVTKQRKEPLPVRIECPRRRVGRGGGDGGGGGGGLGRRLALFGRGLRGGAGGGRGGALGGDARLEPLERLGQAFEDDDELARIAHPFGNDTWQLAAAPMATQTPISAVRGRSQGDLRAGRGMRVGHWAPRGMGEEIATWHWGEETTWHWGEGRTASRAPRVSSVR